MRKRYAVLAIGWAVVLASCGGGSGDGGTTPPPPPPPQPTDAGGIWEGTAVTGDLTLDVVGIIAEDGEGRFVDENGTQYVIDTLGGNDGDVSLTFTAFAQVGFTFIDGSTIATGTLAGSIDGTSFSAEYDLSTGESGTMTLGYDPLYERDSSLDKLTGLWDEEFGVMSFDTFGGFFMQDTFGCVFEGQVSIIDPDFNVYSLAMSVSSCGAGVDGQYSGLGILADLDTAEDLFIVQMNSDEWIFTTALTRQ